MDYPLPPNKPPAHSDFERMFGQDGYDMGVPGGQWAPGEKQRAPAPQPQQPQQPDNRLPQPQFEEPRQETGQQPPAPQPQQPQAQPQAQVQPQPPQQPQPQQPQQFSYLDEQQTAYPAQPQQPSQAQPQQAQQGAQPQQEGQPGQQPGQQLPGVVELQTKEGYPITVPLSEVGEIYGELPALRKSHERVQALEEWASRHPERARVMMDLMQGKDPSAAQPQRGQGPQYGAGIEGPSGLPAQPRGEEPYEGDEGDEDARRVRRYVQPLEHQVQQLHGTLTDTQRELDVMRREREREADARRQGERQRQLDAALNDHPFTKQADAQVRDAVGQLALMDVDRYDGVRIEDAVRKRANDLEAQRRQGLARQAQGQPVQGAQVPTPIPGSGAPVPQQVPDRRFQTGGFGSGLHRALEAAKEAQDQGNRQ